MKINFCHDYTYFSLGIAFGDIVGALVLTVHLGFWQIEWIVREHKNYNSNWK